MPSMAIIVIGAMPAGAATQKITDDYPVVQEQLPGSKKSAMYRRYGMPILHRYREVT
jgi:hypothetical protein